VVKLLNKFSENKEKMMKSKVQGVSALVAVCGFVLLVSAGFVIRSPFEKKVLAQEKTAIPSPTPAFDQALALAALREQIKGKETEPAEKVFKNIKVLNGVPAGRLLAMMNFGYARSLGVDCTHCHTPEKWESDEKAAKPVARDMKLLADEINGRLLKNMKSLGTREAVVNCTTCHRGEIKPALNLPTPTPASSAAAR
jgi:hypothetical protein